MARHEDRKAGQSQDTPGSPQTAYISRDDKCWMAQRRPLRGGAPFSGVFPSSPIAHTFDLATPDTQHERAVVVARVFSDVRQKLLSGRISQATLAPALGVRTHERPTVE